jgi:hypothetical protein
LYIQAAGGFLMNGAQELLVAIEHDLHVTIMILSAPLHRLMLLLHNLPQHDFLLKH